jgi:monofunctional biosynthetic peptidoglycan transglycosylase
VGRWIAGLLGVGFGYAAYVYLTLPDVRPLARTPPASTAFMDLRDREARAAGRTPRHVHRFVPYNRISADLKRAVLVAEDAAFWDHDGVDYVELQKSIELDWARGQLLRGASTITQQLAKNLYLSPTRNPIRKIRELIVARRLEGALTKTRILELYLNLIEWGDGIYGIEAAARTYFGVPASALNARQSALLAGAIINPRLLNPAKPTARLQRRQQLILSRMGAVQPPNDPVKAAPAQSSPAPDRPQKSPPIVDELPPLGDSIEPTVPSLAPQQIPPP